MSVCEHVVAYTFFKEKKTYSFPRGMWKVKLLYMYKTNVENDRENNIYKWTIAIKRNMSSNTSDPCVWKTEMRWAEMGLKQREWDRLSMVYFNASFTCGRRTIISIIHCTQDCQQHQQQ